MNFSKHVRDVLCVPFLFISFQFYFIYLFVFFKNLTQKKIEMFFRFWGGGIKTADFSNMTMIDDKINVEELKKKIKLKHQIRLLLRQKKNQNSSLRWRKKKAY